MIRNTKLYFYTKKYLINYKYLLLNLENNILAYVVKFRRLLLSLEVKRGLPDVQISCNPWRFLNYHKLTE